MSVAAERDSATFHLPFYYGWVNVLLAAMAMTATLPGRTHGLGLITEPLLRDLQLDPVRYASFNLWATLIGASFCLVIGPLIDRYGVRVVLTGVALLLGATTCAMSRVTTETGLIATMTLTRGLGQSALSVVSMAMVGKWFRRRIGPAMGVNTVLLTIGFIITTLGVGHAVKSFDWRTVWNGVGLSLIFGLVPLGAIFVRSTPSDEELARSGRADEFSEDTGESSSCGSVSSDFTLGETLGQPAFWALALGTSMFNLIWSATTLFNESILKERGLPPDTFVNAMATMTATGLTANLLAGWVAGKCSMNRLLAVGLLMMAPLLFLYPRLTSVTAAICHAGGMGLVGGIVTVVFFSAWSRVFGRSHLGRIQGAAQIVSVLASAVGPLLLTMIRERTGSFSAFYHVVTLVVLALAVWSWFVSEPKRDHRKMLPLKATWPVTAGRGPETISASLSKDTGHA